MTDLTIREELRSCVGRQKNLSLVAELEGAEVARLDFSDYNDEPSVQMIEVRPEHRRKGIATELVFALQLLYPEDEIHFGMMTGHGTYLYQSLPFVEKPSIWADDFEKLQTLRQMCSEQTALAEKQSGTNRLLAYDTWNRVNQLEDEIDELERDLYGRKPMARYVDVQGYRERQTVLQTIGRKDLDNFFRQCASESDLAAYMKQLSAQRPDLRTAMLQWFSDYAPFYEDTSNLYLKMTVRQAQRFNERDLATKEIAAAYPGSLLGAQIGNKAGTLFALIHLDTENSSKARLTYFSERGFTGHCVFSSPEKALEAAVGEGYLKPYKGKLSQLSQTPAFLQGNEAALRIQDLNSGRITWDEFLSRNEPDNPNLSPDLSSLASRQSVGQSAHKSEDFEAGLPYTEGRATADLGLDHSTFDDPSDCSNHFKP